jgi:hypothetical protein
MPAKPPTNNPRQKIIFILTDDGILGFIPEVENGKLRDDLLEAISAESGLLIEEIKEIFRDNPEIPMTLSRSGLPSLKQLLETVGCEVEVLSSAEVERNRQDPKYHLPIFIGLLAKKHYHQIGPAIWVFLWLIDKVTQEYEDADGMRWGKVLGGRPFRYQNIADYYGISLITVKRYINTLKKWGYIRTGRDQYGVIVELRNSRKWISRSIKNDTALIKNDTSEPSKRRPDGHFPTVTNSINKQNKNIYESSSDSTPGETSKKTSKKSGSKYTPEQTKQMKEILEYFDWAYWMVTGEDYRPFPGRDEKHLHELLGLYHPDDLREMIRAMMFIYKHEYWIQELSVRTLWNFRQRFYDGAGEGFYGPEDFEREFGDSEEEGESE